MTSTETNLWSSFLRESSKRTQSQESTCIIVGDEHCGKRQLSSVLCTQDADKENSASKNSIVSYNYFDIDDKDLETTTRVNTWLFEKNIFDNSFDILKSTCKTDKLIVVLVLDLSKPDTCLTSLQKWLVNINSFTSKYFAEQNPENTKTQKQALLDYLKNVRKTKGAVVAPATTATATVVAVAEETESEEPEEHFEGNFISEFFGLPVVVVGTKADTVVSDSSAAMKQARELQGRIRSVCVEAGAGLVFTSTAGGAVQTNCAELKKYIMHRLYPGQIGMELSLEDKLERTFIPAGFDTADLIKISTGVKTSSGSGSSEWQAKFKADVAKKAAQSVLPASTNTSDPTASTATTASSGEYKAELENEQLWLSGLHDFIQQVSASGAPSGAPSAGHSRVPSDATALPASTSSGNIAGGAAKDSNSGVGVKGEGELADGVASMGIADGETTTAPKKVTGSRRASTAGTRGSVTGGAAGAAGAKPEVGDFFKNLLNKK